MLCNGVCDYFSVFGFSLLFVWVSDMCVRILCLVEGVGVIVLLFEGILLWVGVVV